MPDSLYSLSLMANMSNQSFGSVNRRLKKLKKKRCLSIDAGIWSGSSKSWQNVRATKIKSAPRDPSELGHKLLIVQLRGRTRQDKLSYKKTEKASRQLPYRILTDNNLKYIDHPEYNKYLYGKR